MALAAQTFKVVTQFVFEESALQGADGITKKIQSISDHADQAVKQVGALGSRFLLSFTGLGGGIIGVLHQATKASQNFYQSQLDLATIFASNSKMVGGAQDFAEHLQLADETMKKISKTAMEFALPEEGFAETTKLTTGLLATKAKPGTPLEKIVEQSVDLSRKALKTASVTNIDNNRMLYFMQMLMEGQSVRGLVATQTLQAEAGDVLGKHGVGHIAELSTMKVEKKIKVLNAVLDKFANQTGLAEMRARSLTGQIQRLYNVFLGFNSVLKPLGDIVRTTLAPLMGKVVDFIDTQGRMIIKQFAFLMQQIFKDPKRVLEELLALSKAGGHARIAGLISSINVLISHIKQFEQSFGWVGKVLGFFGNLIKTVFKIAIFTVTPWLLKLAWVIGKVLLVAVIPLIPLLVKMAAVWAGLFAIFQVGSRIITKFKLDFAKWFQEGGKAAELGTRSLTALKMMGPQQLTNLLNTAADNIFNFLQRLLGAENVINMLEWIVSSLENVALALANAITNFKFNSLHAINIIDFVFSALALTIRKGIEKLYYKIMPDELAHLLIGPKTAPLADQFTSLLQTTKATGLELEKGRDAELLANLKQIMGLGANAPVAHSMVTNEKVVINQNFKEKVSPDRIAFSIVEGLKKETGAATQSEGQIPFGGAPGFGRRAMGNL